ncbi:P-loop NTPase fold protein, partial [Phascolarctobacterium faecium]|uniref:P-loop NTPase fold protein n=1 Tax=Phascolarctobacterium faecium TaxID=33025 RepID=UPI003AEF2983
MIKDILQRDKFVRQVVKLINTMEKRNSGYTFAIDGKWGCGKSFVLEMIEKEISIFEATEK